MSRDSISAIIDNAAISEKLFENTVITKVLTPYYKLRRICKFTPTYASRILNVSVSTLNRYERGAQPVPKGTIIRMDELYRCNGRLINYWLKHDLCAEAEVLQFFTNKNAD